MMSRRLLAAVALLCAIVPAHAQKTKSALSSEIGTNFPDNTNGFITPLQLRNTVLDILNSIMPTAPVGSGNLACFSGTTGLLQDCGSNPVVSGITATTTSLSTGTVITSQNSATPGGTTTAEASFQLFSSNFTNANWSTITGLTSIGSAGDTFLLRNNITGNGFGVTKDGFFGLGDSKLTPTVLLDVINPGSGQPSFAGIARLARIGDGTSSARVTSITPSVAIQRAETFSTNTASGNSGALFVSNQGSNTSAVAQTIGLSVSASQIGQGDVVAGFFSAQQAGTALANNQKAFGIFSFAQAAAGSTVNGAVGVNSFVDNRTGVDCPTANIGSTSACWLVGNMVQSGGGANLSTAGIYIISAAPSNFDTGIYIDPGAVKTNAFKSNNFTITASGVVATSGPPGTTATIDATGQSVTMANGTNTQINILRGLVLVTEVSAIGSSAVYLCSQLTCVLVSTAGPALWVASTTTPAAGQASVAWDGTSSFRIYNNRGGTSNFNVMQLKTT